MSENSKTGTSFFIELKHIPLFFHPIETKLHVACSNNRSPRFGKKNPPDILHIAMIKECALLNLPSNNDPCNNDLRSKTNQFQTKDPTHSRMTNNALLLFTSPLPH